MRRPPCLEPLHAIERASLDELQSLQLDRLQGTLHHAYEHSPVYRARFDASGVHPQDLKSLDDLARFPTTGKADLRDNYPFGMFAVPMDQVIRIHASSGTTGKPTVVGCTRADIDMWAEVAARSIRAAGGQAGDRVHVAYGYGLFTGGLGAHYGAERLGCTVIPMSGGQTEKQVQLIHDFDPDIIMVTPSYMLSIADEMDRQGVDPDTLSLRAGIFGAEPWTAAMRRQLERRSASTPLTSMACRRSSGPALPRSASRARTVPPSGKTISTRKSSIPIAAPCYRTVPRANWFSPPSPSRRYR